MLVMARECKTVMFAFAVSCTLQSSSDSLCIFTGLQEQLPVQAGSETVHWQTKADSSSVQVCSQFTAAQLLKTDSSSRWVGLKLQQQLSTVAA